METIKDLIEKRKALQDKTRATQDRAKQENDRPLTKEEGEVIDADMDEIEKLDGEIATRQKKEEDDYREARLKKALAERQIQQARRVPSEFANNSWIEVRHGFPMTGEVRFSKTQEARRQAYVAGMFLRGVLFGDAGAFEWLRSQNDIDVRALGTSVNSQGGYLSPDQLVAMVKVYEELRGVFSQNAEVIDMPREIIQWPRSTGGVTMYPVVQNNTVSVTESTPTFDLVELIAKEWGALIRMSRVMSEDSVINLAEFVAQRIGYSQADKQDNAGFLGDGTSTYHGIQGLLTKVGAAGTVTAITGNTAFGTLDLEDFEACVGKLPLIHHNGAKWYISNAGFAASAQRLMDAAGGNTIDILAGGSRTKQFLGYPVVLSQVLNSTLSAQVSTIVAYFGNLRESSMLGVRRALDIQVLNERYAELSQIGIFGSSRWTINNYHVGDATNVGAIVALKTAAS